MGDVAAVSLDLFDTLVDHHMQRLPRVRLDPDDPAPGMPSTLGALHRAVRAHAELTLGEFAAALRAVDGELRGERRREHRELPTLERFAALLARLGIEAPGLAEELTEVHMGLLREVSEAPAHHRDVLRGLRSRVRLALCSNFTHTPTARRVLEEAGLAEHFDAVVVSEAVGFRKPRREIFDAVVEGLGVEPGAILHVGDNLAADVAGAAAAGMRTAWITRRVPDREAALRGYEGPAPEFVVSDLGELASLVGTG